MSRDLDRLCDIAEYLGKLAAHRPVDVKALKADEVLAAAMVRWIEIVGEAAANVSDAIRDRYPDVPWTDIVAMRDPEGQAHDGAVAVVEYEPYLDVTLADIRAEFGIELPSS